MVDVLNAGQRELHHKVCVAQRFFATHKVPYPLQEKVLAAVRAAFNEGQLSDSFEKLVGPLLSHDLLHQLNGSIYEDLMRRFPPFRESDVPAQFLHKLAFEATKKFYSKDDF